MKPAAEVETQLVRDTKGILHLHFINGRSKPKSPIFGVQQNSRLSLESTLGLLNLEASFG